MADEEGVLIDSQLAGYLKEIALEWLAGKLSLSATRKAEPIFTQTPIYFTNDSGETIPPYACMQVVGTLELGGQNYCKVHKPIDTDGTAGAFIVNGSAEVLDDDEGTAQNGPIVRVFKDTGTVTAGDMWGPTAGQWYMTKNNSDWIACGEDDIETDVFKAFLPAGGDRHFRYTLTSSTNGTVLDMTGANTIATGVAIVDTLSMFSDQTTGDGGVCFRQGGVYYRIQAPCKS